MSTDGTSSTFNVDGTFIVASAICVAFVCLLTIVVVAITRCVPSIRNLIHPYERRSRTLSLRTLVSSYSTSSSFDSREWDSDGDGDNDMEWDGDDGDCRCMS